MLRPAINSTDDPPVPITDVLLREYVYALRRRIEVGNDLLEALTRDLMKLKQERDGLTNQLERVMLDLYWYESGRKIDKV
jgi:hypothetical protein